MDGSRFDALARAMVNARSRRSVLGAAFGGLAAAMLGDRVNAAGTMRSIGEICRKNGDCGSGLCGPKDRTGRRYCGCVTATDCPEPSTPCGAATCVAGVCGTGGFKSAGTVCRASSHLCDPTSVCTGSSSECTYDPLALEGRICYGGVIGGFPPTDVPPNPCDITTQTRCKNNVCDDTVIRRCT